METVMDQPRETYLKLLFLGIAFILLSLYINLLNHLLFHTLIEMVCIFISMGMFMISIHSYQFRSNPFITFLGVTHGFVAVLDLFHGLTFEGIGIFTFSNTNICTQFWIAARFVQSLSIFIGFYLIHRDKKVKLNSIFMIYIIGTVVLILSIMYWRNFPLCFTEDTGLTMFKTISEYIIVGIFFIAAMILKKNKMHMSNKKYYLLFMLTWIAIISELLFSNHLDINNTIFVLGHILKLIYFYILYRVVIKFSLLEPYEKIQCLNRRLEQSNVKLERINEKLRNKERILQGILHSSSSGICVVNHEGKFLYTNPMFKQLWNVSDELIEEKTSWEMAEYIKEQLKEPNQLVYKINEIIATQAENIDYLEFKDGRIFERTHYPLLEDDVYKGKVWSFRDITEKKEAEEQISVLKEVEERDRIKTEFFSNISHELKTPLNIILGIVQILGHKNQEIKQVSNQESIFLDKYITMMKQNTYRLLRLINNLIDITRIDVGFLKVSLKNRNIVYVIEEITVSIVDYARSKGIELIFDTDVEEKILACDGDKMERVMLNLLSNAIKFTGQGGQIQVNLYDKEEYILISVKDTGIGIPEEKLGKIFDRFGQVGTPLHKRAEGSGIGLSLVKGIVEMHGGEISVESKEKEGSEFIIKLPVKIIDETDIYDKMQINAQNKIETIHIEFSDIYDAS